MKNRKIILYAFIAVFLIIMCPGCNSDENALSPRLQSSGNGGGPARGSAASPASETGSASLPQPTGGAEGLAHEPFGSCALYGAKEAPEVWWKREPAEPVADEKVKITAASWKGGKNDVVLLEWALNGKMQEPLELKHTANLKDNGITKWKCEAEIGPFRMGDRVEYSICRGESADKAETVIGGYSFTVSGWESAEEIDSVASNENGLLLTFRTKSLHPSVAISELSDQTLNFNLSVAGSPRKSETANRNQESGDYSLDHFIVTVNPDPFSFEVKDKLGKPVVRTSRENAVEFLTDGQNITKFRINLAIDPEDEFYGFGMKYDSLDQRGKDVATYCVNWYTDQRDKTYAPVPFYFVPDKYGLFLDSTYLSYFRIDTEVKDICRIEANMDSARDPEIGFYLFGGSNAEIMEAYAGVTAKPVLPPVWAFGPWISANEWNRQSEVLDQVRKTKENNIPSSVIVIEAWSDEETFYTFNDSTFAPNDGSAPLSLSDFTFGGRWPDPKEMINQIHDAGMKVLLWQIPVLKASPYATVQSISDQEYAKKMGYVLKNPDGTPYAMPENTWFGGSMLVDFTNPDAANWFLDKRRYLLSDLKIDGFKTDGGEFIWGKGVASFDGRLGDELRNAYPDIYAQSYFNYARKINPDAITFSRSGGAYLQSHPVCWTGDQKSDFNALNDALRAMLSASMSGIPFVAWDAGGFSGDIPTTGLYQRAIALSAFCPIMQVHSEASGDPVPSMARTPWNMAERKGSPVCLDTYRFYANARMSLLPYIYSEAHYSSESGEPLMRSMAYAYPEDDEARRHGNQYMFGRNLLVAPVTEEGRMEIEVYLPGGKWYGLFDGKEYSGGKHVIGCPPGEIPVFVKSGSILPIRLGKDLEFASDMDNKTDDYDNLAFRAYPGDGHYVFYDYLNDEEINIAASNSGREWTISGNGLRCVYLEAFGKAGAISVNGEAIESAVKTNENFTLFKLAK